MPIKQIHKQKGFTLIELLVVISIIALLSTIVLQSFNDARMKARDSKRIQDLNAVKMALNTYLLDHGSVPVCGASADGNWCSGCDNPTGLATVLETLADNDYISELPIDPIASIVYTNGTDQCYNYEYYSGVNGDNSANNWRCAGQSVDNYHYVIRFATEKTSFNLPVFNNADRSSYGAEYCILGPEL